MQDWLQANSPDFIAKNLWLPTLPNLNLLDYHGLSHVPSETKNNRRTERNVAVNLGQPTQEPIDINKADKEFWKQMMACVAAGMDNLNILSESDIVNINLLCFLMTFE